MRRDLELYRRQHRELLAAAAELEALAARTQDDSGEGARAQLALLAGKLVVHLQMEDRQLYPELLSSPSGELRRTAERFRDEMGATRAVADAFFRRWLAGGAIGAAPGPFLAELRPLVRALGNRIAAEDRVLFPLAEQGD
jgi:iron-sulfur cluster repair protein YtfE (RIC family)